MPSIARRGPKPERAQLRALKTAFCIHRAEPRRGELPCVFLRQACGKPRAAWLSFNSIFFLSSGSRTTATSLLLAPLLGLLDGESRGIGQSKPKPVHKRAERFTQSCWTEPSGALWACASDKAAQLQVHGFVSTPGPSCFRVGSMFSGVPIHRIAGAFEPNRALVTVASREAR